MVCLKAREGQKETHNTSRQSNGRHDCLDRKRKYQGSKLQSDGRDIEVNTAQGPQVFVDEEPELCHCRRQVA